MSSAIKTALALFFVVIVCVTVFVNVGKDTKVYVSVRSWIDGLGAVFSEFPNPAENESALDYIGWTGEIFQWLGSLWNYIVSPPSNRVQDFDGSIGAIPVTPPVMAM